MTQKTQLQLPALPGRIRSYKTYYSPYMYFDFENKHFDTGKVSVGDVAGTLIAGPTSTFDSDAPSADGILIDAAGDEVWIDNNTTGTRLLGGSYNAGFKIQQIEYDAGNLLRVWGDACTYFRCNSSPTDIAGELDVTNLAGTLTQLSCHSNSISTLDVSALTALTRLYCYSNNISTLDVSALTSLTYLHCYNNSISTLDVSALTALTYLSCTINSISTLDVSALTALTYLACGYNDLTVLDVSALTDLTELYCYSNNISTLDISALTALTTLYCYNNAMTTENIDIIVEDLYDTWITSPRTGTANIGGTNAHPSGVYRYSASPATPQEKIYAMETHGVYPWTITYTPTTFMASYYTVTQQSVM